MVEGLYYLHFFAFSDHARLDIAYGQNGKTLQKKNLLIGIEKIELTVRAKPESESSGKTSIVEPFCSSTNRDFRARSTIGDGFFENAFTKGKLLNGISMDVT